MIMSTSELRWWVYILRCQGGVFYTGITTDILRRFKAHQQGKGARFTRSHKPLEIWCRFGPYTRTQALQEEHRIKKLSHQAKEDLERACCHLLTVHQLSPDTCIWLPHQ